VTYSPDYQKQLRDLHDRESSFGGGRHVLTVVQLVNLLHVKSIADYGAGKMRLAEVLREEFHLKFDYFPYDPAFPEYGEPRAADLVCCIEVLEHVEPEHINSVLEDLARITINYGFFTIHCSDSGKFLRDGRNAHLLQRPISWWVTKLSNYFEIQWLDKTGTQSFAVLISPSGAESSGLPALNLYQRDSLKDHVSTCIAALRVEVARRLRRGHWRPQ